MSASIGMTKNAFNVHFASGSDFLRQLPFTLSLSKGASKTVARIFKTMRKPDSGFHRNKKLTFFTFNSSFFTT